MAVYLRMQHSHSQRLQAAAAAAASGSISGSGSGSNSSTGHSLAVASSVDQGLSLSQMLLWHLDDARQEAAAAAAAAAGDLDATSSSGSNGNVEQDSAAARTGAAAIHDAYATAARQSSNAAAGSSSSSSRVRSADVPAGISLVSGCMSGFLTATATFPLDVVRRRMQVYGRQHQGEAVRYRQIIRQISSQGRGLRGFYVGILPEYCKVVPGVAIAFCTYEQLKKFLRVE